MLTMLLQSQMQNNPKTTKKYQKDWIFLFVFIFCGTLWKGWVLHQSLYEAEMEPMKTGGNSYIWAMVGIESLKRLEKDLGLNVIRILMYMVGGNKYFIS